MFIRQAFSLDNIADGVIDRLDPSLRQSMAWVRGKVSQLPDASLLREEEWKKMMGDIGTYLQSTNNVFAQFLIDDLRVFYPELKKTSEKMIREISPVNLFPGTAGQIEGMPTIGGLQTVELQDSVKDAIRNTKVNNTRLVDLFGLQDVDMAKPAIFRQTMTPWIKSNLKIIDRTVRTGILQGADTQAIADQIAGVMITGVKKRGVLDPATKLFTEGKDAYTQIKAQAKAVARTAVQDMNRQVNEQVWDEQTFSSDLRWEWVAAFDSRTCPVCAPLDNILRKDRKSFPEWPVHVNCRCQVVLVDPEDKDARAGIDISPEEDGFDRPGGREKPGRKYKSKINVKGEQFYRKAFDVKGENPSYADFLAQSDRVTQGTFFGGGNAGSIRAEKFQTYILEGKTPTQALHKLITNAPKPKSVLRKIDIEKVKFKDVDLLIRADNRRLETLKKSTVQLRNLQDRGDRYLKKNHNSIAVYESINRKLINARIEIDKRYQTISNKIEKLIGPTGIDPKDMEEIKMLSAKRKKLSAQHVRMMTTEQDAFKKVTDKMRKVRRGITRVTPEFKEYIEKTIDSIEWKQPAVGSIYKDRLTKIEIKVTAEQNKKDLKSIKNNVRDFMQMFKGKGFNGVEPIKQIEILARDKRGYNFNNQVWTTPNKKTCFHECMHTIEKQRPELFNAARKWLSEKAYDQKALKKLRSHLVNVEPAYFKNNKPAFEASDVKQNLAYSGEQPRWVNEYLDGYMGVLYPDFYKATEVWSVLAGEFATPDGMAKVYRKHPDLFKAIIGLALGDS